MRAMEAIQRMREVIRRQQKALATEETCVHWLRRYISALQDIPSTLTSQQKLERFLTGLALTRDVAASTQNQAFKAIAFFYKDVLGTPLHDVDALRATRPVHLRHAPTITETRALLQAVSDVGVKIAPRQRLAWQSRNDGSAVVRPLPSVMELAGSLKSDVPFSSIRSETEAARAAWASLSMNSRRR